MRIIGIEGMTGDQIIDELNEGGKFVVYSYCVSVIILTFQRGSDIHFIRPGQNAVAKGLSFTLLSLLLGWWGIPWGPIFTIGAVVTNFAGGKNVTSEVIAALMYDQEDPADDDRQ